MKQRTTSVVEIGAMAWRDRPTRRAVRGYILRSLGMLMAGPALFVATGLLLADGGDHPRKGIPDLVIIVLILLAFFIAVYGLARTANSLRIRWVLGHYPWETIGEGISTAGDVVGDAVPTWESLGAGTTAFVSAPPEKGGVVTDVDRAHIAWAGRATVRVLREEARPRPTKQGPLATGQRRTPGEWLKNDLKGMNRPGSIVPTIRRHPAILVRAAIQFAIGLAVVAGILAVVGSLDAFGDWWGLAAVHAGLSGGRDVHRHQAR